MMARAKAGDVASYGDDSWTEQACASIQELFGARGGVFLVFNGAAAHVRGSSLLRRPYEAVVLPEGAHRNVDECGAAERVLGSKLLTVPAPDGKLTPALIAGRLGDRGDVHRAQPRAVAISQVTERGTCYMLEELQVLGEFCRS